MAELVPLAEAFVAVAFAVLAVVAVARAPRTGAAGWWAAAAFGSLALALTAVWLPDWFGLALPEETGGIQLLLILAFPYLLLRFTATFRELPRALEVAAAAGAVLAGAVMVLPLLRRSSVGDEPAGLFALAVFVYWSGVSLVTVVRLWRAGAGQPGVARRRMRLMAVATAALAIALITAITFADNSATMELVSLGFAVASALAFGLGFMPPRLLRLSWRQEEERQLQEATTALLRAETIQEVADGLLPPTLALLGGRGTAMVDRNGRVVATCGDAPDVGQQMPSLDSPDPTRESAPLGQAGRRLVAWTSSYTPFFGPEEIALFRAMAAVGGLALDRCALLAEERAQHDAATEARQDAEAARLEAERARAEADRANVAKSEFLSRMSHELRTPLNAILGFGQLLETADLEEEDRTSVGYILKAGRHLLSLINDVLDLSRIEAGVLSLSLEPVHAAELIRDTVALVRPLANERSIALSSDADDCDAYVLTDRQRCRQVLLNLLSNAIKYNHDGGEVEIRCTPDGDDSLRIEVRDTGPGIDPSRQDRLFEPFDRLGAESSGVEGTGLGLALTKQLVERLGGNIGVDSVLGEGSRFWIDLPTTSVPSDAVADADPPSPSTSTGEQQLLLVEDNLANLRVVEAMLRRRPGISVLPAMQATLALELAYQHMPDVIVLDLHLPDLPGREVLHRLKADPRTRGIPVVVASADATPGTIRQLHDDGAFDYVTKPLDLERFLAVVDAALTQGSQQKGTS